jgi:hypothetical protein
MLGDSIQEEGEQERRGRRSRGGGSDAAQQAWIKAWPSLPASEDGHAPAVLAENRCKRPRSAIRRSKIAQIALCSNFEAGATGLEPATSGVTGRRSNQLSYAPRGALQYGKAPPAAPAGEISDSGATLVATSGFSC